MQQLVNDVAIIKRVFPIHHLLNKKLGKEEIIKYYIANHLSYLFFHNKEGFMHMGLSSKGKYTPNDLLEPLRIINAYMQQMHARNVLELGAGNGSNSAYLAKKNPHILFKGIDLSKTGLKKNISLNYKQITGDFHDLHIIEDNSIDLVFVIEALCHSTDKMSVFDEVYKKLTKDGIMIIFDGYLLKKRKELSEDEHLAVALTEKSMAVDAFDDIASFNATIRQTKFRILEKKDYSKSILPTLRRFKKKAEIYFKTAVIRKPVEMLLGELITQNAIAGFLMLDLITEHIACYYLHVLQKK